MPELPEVETLKRELSTKIKGQMINQTVVLNEKTVAPLSSKKFKKELKGKIITGVSRRAKLLVLHLNAGNFLVFHLKMTGQVIFAPAKGRLVGGGHPYPPTVAGHIDLPNKYTRVIFHFADNSTLYFNDLRKFGWIRLFERKELTDVFLRHGVEPLSKNFTIDFLKTLIARWPNKNIKQLLLDQTHIAGLGNIYVDEACFEAKILPSRACKTLTAGEIKALFTAIRHILTLSIKHKGTSARNYVTSTGEPGNFVKHLKVYGRKNKKCLRCKKGVIERTKIAGRGTHFCPRCQK